jgi:hypothetical protein
LSLKIKDFLGFATKIQDYLDFGTENSAFAAFLSEIANIFPSFLIQTSAIF